MSAVFLAAIAPIYVFDGLPMAAGFVLIMDPDLPVLYLFLLISIASYLLSSMIVRHTYQRRILRFGLFMLSYWAAIAFQVLWKGEITLFLPPMH